MRPVQAAGPARAGHRAEPGVWSAARTGSGRLTPQQTGLLLHPIAAGPRAAKKKGPGTPCNRRRAPNSAVRPVTDRQRNGRGRRPEAEAHCCAAQGGIIAPIGMAYTCQRPRGSTAKWPAPDQSQASHRNLTGGRSPGDQHGETPARRPQQLGEKPPAFAEG